jgi:hypothetical protein
VNNIEYDANKGFSYEKECRPMAQRCTFPNKVYQRKCVEGFGSYNTGTIEQCQLHLAMCYR